jgi:hypothetical protein
MATRAPRSARERAAPRPPKPAPITTASRRAGSSAGMPASLWAPGWRDQAGRMNKSTGAFVGAHLASAARGCAPLVRIDAAGDPERAAMVTRGDAIFHEPRQDCAGSHVDEHGTDALTHDIGSAVSADRDVPFDTPSLRFVGGTAPYFHDGHAAARRRSACCDGAAIAGHRAAGRADRRAHARADAERSRRREPRAARGRRRADRHRVCRHGRARFFVTSMTC